jgi:iron(III) transport system substrate-binding protein
MMRARSSRSILSVALFLLLFSRHGSYATAATAPLLRAQQESEAKGYIFSTSHDVIVDLAKKEGRLRVLASQDKDTLKAVVDAFKKKYPFIDVHAEEVAGRETYDRMLQEVKAGLANWDVNYLGWDSYTEYLPYQKKFDILRMVKQGVLGMPAMMVDPVHGNVVALQSNMQVVAYNSEVISNEKVPKAWEDFLRPEFKGRKFALDIREKALHALVPVWGLEKVLDLARKLPTQNPVWFRGDSRVLPLVSMGEVGVAWGVNYKSVRNQQEKDRRKVLEYKLVEPIPARLTEAQAVLSTASNPHAALLWLEFQASPEGQKILDQTDLAASILSPGSIHEQVTRGKKISIVAWDHFQKTGDYSKRIVEAMGFPRVEKR